MNIKKLSQDYYLLGSVFFLIIFGLVMLFSASWVKSLEVTNGESRSYFFSSQLLKFLPGLMIFLFFSFFNYRKLQKIAILSLITTFILLLYTKFQGCNLDSCRWLSIGPISFQTSDLARFSIILFLADYIDRNHKKMISFDKGILIPLLWILPSCILVLIQPDNSTTLIILSIALIMLFIGGASFPQILTISILGISTVGFMLLNKGNYALSRITSFFNESSVVNYQSDQAIIGLQQGGFWGLGVGNSVQKYNYLPETHTDFIFAIIGEELGFFAGMILILIYAFILIRAVQIAKKSNDIFGIMLSLGFGISISIYALINIGVVIGLLPVTGVPLPFISYGGSSFIINILMIAILLNISKSKREFKLKNWRLKVNA
jgi:cell division protein FtsW